jgi:hypothetical protein
MDLPLAPVLNLFMKPPRLASTSCEHNDVSVVHWHLLFTTDIMIVLFLTFLLFTGAQLAVVVGVVIWQPIPFPASSLSPVPLHHVHSNRPATLRLAHMLTWVPRPGRLHGLR